MDFFVDGLGVFFLCIFIIYPPCRPFSGGLFPATFTHERDAGVDVCLCVLFSLDWHVYTTVVSV